LVELVDQVVEQEQVVTQQEHLMLVVQEIHLQLVPLKEIQEQLCQVQINKELAEAVL
jgi:hypothetical protein